MPLKIIMGCRKWIATAQSREVVWSCMRVSTLISGRETADSTRGHRVSKCSQAQCLDLLYSISDVLETLLERHWSKNDHLVFSSARNISSVGFTCRLKLTLPLQNDPSSLFSTCVCRVLRRNLMCFLKRKSSEVFSYTQVLRAMFHLRGLPAHLCPERPQTDLTALLAGPWNDYTDPVYTT